MQEFRNPVQGLTAFFRSGSALSVFIIINTVVWLILSLIRVPLFLSSVPEEFLDEKILHWLSLPADPWMVMHRPWTIFTYMFLHVEFLHILFNMLWLYWFGKIFTEYLNDRKLIITYLLGGISGGLLYILFYNIFPVFEAQRSLSFALGASAAVMAIVSTISFYTPNYSLYFIFIGRLKIIYIWAVLFVLDFFMIRSGNSGGHIAHIGGALFGILYATILRKGFNIGELKDVFRPGGFMTAKPYGEQESRPFRRKKAPPSRPLNDDEYNLMKAAKQKKIDEILDKIAKSGYESLTRAEKEFLFRESQR